MTQDSWNAVDAYFNGVLGADDEALTHALEASRAAGLPAIAVAPNQGKLLMILARTIGAKAILEVGTLGGYSTIWLARGLGKGGSVVSLEIDPHHAQVARDSITFAGLSEVVEVRQGPALELLPLLEAESGPPFDLVFIDADKPSNPDYFAWALKMTRPGGLIVVDNVVRGGAVVDPAGDASVQGVRRLAEAVAAEPRVTATALQTLGDKGYDGLMVIRVET
ncbi:methyltransferase domain-containing protein [Caulobacter sp. SLTY]|uniref:class I SAM-dependent methyltransferase n=1 Tax=Caulobacter sp. SLTY TaxID=2683262 RepID=UPI001412DAEE|nr:methyltransferase domain-containing protein [Caulobacter sp. SLTY]